MSAESSLLLCDGRIAPADAFAISPLDRAVLFGLGAFETVRLWGGRPFLFERHLERLDRTLAALGLPSPPARASLPEDVVALAERAGRPDALCRVTVTGGPEPGPDGTARPRLFALLREVPPPVRGRTVRVGIAPVAHTGASPMAGVKTTSYLFHYRLRERAEREGRFDDLMVTPDGAVTEASVANAFIVRDGRLATPPIGDGLLPGVTRGLVLELAREAGLEAAETHLAADDVRAADELFLTGAGRGLVSVDAFDGAAFPAARPVADRLRAMLAARIAAACGVDAADVVF